MCRKCRWALLILGVGAGILVIASMTCCYGQNGNANPNFGGNQGWSGNAMPDEEGNWRAIGGRGDPPPSGPFIGGNIPRRVNSDPNQIPPEEREPRPMMVNTQRADRNQKLLDRLPNARGPMKHLMRSILGNKGGNDTRAMMRNIMNKGKGAMNKLLEKLKDSNSSVLVMRQPRQFIPSACTQEMLQIQSDCFSKNGFSLDAFFNNLRNGSLDIDSPSNTVSDLKTQFCNKRQTILDCAIPEIINKRDKPPCLDVHDYNYGQEMALKGIRIIQDVCEAGLLPAPPICVPLVNREMQRCYTKVGFSPDMFISNDSNVEGAVIGKDFNSAQKFCGSRTQLYECMRLVLMNCPDAEQHLLIAGHDQDAIENSIDVLCDNKKVYVDGLTCFQTPSETVHNCIDVMSSQTLDLEAKQMWKSMNKQDFYKEFCRIRVQHMECDTTAWKESCHKVTVGLKNEFQCAMLPGICYNITEIDDVLHNNVCKREAFLEALRAPYSNAVKTSTSWLSSIILGLGIGLSLIL